MQHFSPTHIFKALIPLMPTLYLLSLHPPHRLMLLAVFLYLLLPLPFLTPSGLFNGMIEISEPGALNFYTFFRLIQLTLIVFRNLTLTHFFSFWIPGFPAQQPDCLHSWSGILSPNTMHASGNVIIFVRQGISFCELFTSSFS